MVIGLAGIAECGKSTVGSFLSYYGHYKECSMAGPLRFECHQALTWGEAPAGCPADIHHIVTDLGSTVDVYAKPTSPEARRLLQWWGSEYRRGQNPDYWTERAESMIRFLTAPFYTDDLTSTNIYIGDIRYQNEVDMVKRLGGEVWLVQRPVERGIHNYSMYAHESERFADSPYSWDRVIVNDGTLADLLEKVIPYIPSIEPFTHRPVFPVFVFPPRPVTIELID